MKKIAALASFCLLAFLCLLAPSIALAQSPDAGKPLTLRYNMVMNGKPAGSEVDNFDLAGHIDSAFEFNDRGRGPKIAAHYTLSSAGLPAAVVITGHDYLNAPVDERLTVQGGQAHWKSTTEDGHGPATSFYISNNGPAAETAVLIAALLKAGSAGVPLLPAGIAHVERLTDVTLHDHGQSEHVTEYAITGLGFTPTTSWLDDDLHFFATPGTWAALIREGWEATNKQLYDLQLKADRARYAHLAQTLTKHPQHPVAFEHVRVFDSVNAAMLEDETVVVAGDHITAAGPAASTPVPANADPIDGHGKTLLPGLFDMHVHIDAGDGLLHIASGVTTVRDMGNSIDELKNIQDQWDAGTAIGPRVWKAGLIDGAGPYQAPTGLYVGTPAEAAAAVNRYADLGYIQIKLYSSLDPAFVPAIAALTHQRGLRLSGHIPNGITAAQFVLDGADEIQHINFIMLNFLADKVKETRTPERFTGPGAYAGAIDLQSKPVNDFIALLLQHHTTVDVTMGAFEAMYTGRPGHVSSDFLPVIDRLPAQVQRGALSGGLTVSTDPKALNYDQTYRDSYANMLRMTKKMYEAGVPILAGTDGLAGLMLHRELELEVQAGIPANKALQIATLNAATLLNQQGSFGSIAPGKSADLLLVEGNPAERISDIRRCRLVIKGGALYDSGDLYAAVGILPAK